MDSLISSKLLYQKIYQVLLSAIQEKRECHAITQQLLEHYCQLDAVRIVLNESITLSPTQNKLLSAAITRLQKQEPIQYVLGKAPFLGRYFQVPPAVLIPRPETEAFVQYIINNNPQPGRRILDIGTGSGCIAITLKKELLNATIHALEVDPQALHVAQNNAQQLSAVVHWIQRDVLHDPLPNQRWDIIVSNPPYVRNSEKAQMHLRVLAYEPAQALFVPDENPLLFYDKIVGLAPQHLTPAGKLYLEINETMGTAVARLLTDTGFKEVYIKQDLHGKDRWVVGTLRA